LYITKLATKVQNVYTTTSLYHTYDRDSNPSYKRNYQPPPPASQRKILSTTVTSVNTRVKTGKFKTPTIDRANQIWMQKTSAGNIYIPWKYCNIKIRRIHRWAWRVAIELNRIFSRQRAPSDRRRLESKFIIYTNVVTSTHVSQTFIISLHIFFFFCNNFSYVIRFDFLY